MKTLRNIALLAALLVALQLVAQPTIAPWLRYVWTEPEPSQDTSCAAVGIQFDDTSMRMLYLDTEQLVQNPDPLLARELALRERLGLTNPENGPPIARWQEQIAALADLPDARKEEQQPFALYRQLGRRQEQFCRYAVPRILAYLPPGTDLSASIHLTALDQSMAACSRSPDIMLDLSDPAFVYTARLSIDLGASTALNVLAHELVHIGYNNHYQRPSSDQLGTSTTEMLTALQNEGLATYVAHRLSAAYPAPLEWSHYELSAPTVVQRRIEQMNALLGETAGQENAPAAVTGHAQGAFYVVGAHMASQIERDLGRQALVQTIVDGPLAFVQAYNALVPHQQRIHEIDQ